MDVKQLQSFVSAIDHGSLGKAAARISVSASTISGYINQLEAEFGTELVVRLPQGVVPTAAGKELHQGARTVLQAVEQLRDRVFAAATAEISGLVRVCLPTSPAMLLSLPLLTRLREQHPGIRLELFEGFSGHLEEMLNQNRYDFGLLYRSTPIKGLVVEPLLDEDLVLIGGFDPDDRRDVSISELAELQFVFPSPKHGLRQIIDQAFAAQGVRPRVIADLDTLQAMRDAAFSGLAATILSILRPLENPKISWRVARGIRGVSEVRSFRVLTWTEYMSGTGLQAGQPYGASVRRLTDPFFTRTVALCRPENAPQSQAVITAATSLADLTHQQVLNGTWGGARVRS